MKNYILTVLTVIGLFLGSLSSNAIVIDLGITTGQPADIPSELSRLNGQITLFNDVNNPDLPSASAFTATKTEIENGGNSYVLNLNDFNGYLLLKWGDMDHFYYINDLDATPWSLPTVQQFKSNYSFYSDITNREDGPTLGLSHYTTFSGDTTENVPEHVGWGTLAIAMLFPFTFGLVRRK